MPFCQKNVHSLKNTMFSCHIFQFFHENPMLSSPHFVQSNVYCQKKTLLSCPYFVKKMSILSKTLCSHVIFLIFLWKTPAFMPTFGHKDFSSITTTSCYGTKKSTRCPFADFSWKKSALMPWFCQQMPIF